MNRIRKTYNNKQLRNILLGLFGIVILTLLAGCIGNYGRLQRDAAVQQAFESHQVPTEYKYYYYGLDSRPWAVIGIEPKYELNSKMWQAAAPDTAEFKKMTRWIWEDYSYYKFGANILDPDGNKIGVYYSAIVGTAVKFGDDSQIMVMPYDPWIMGPDGGSREDRL